MWCEGGMGARVCDVRVGGGKGVWCEDGGGGKGVV